MANDVLPLVPLAALNESTVPGGLPDGLVKTASPVGHEEESLIVGESPIRKISQEALYRPVVFSGGLHEAKRDLFSIDRHAQGDC